jgi:DNA-binding NarL/FixJ family response regulator
MVIGGPPYYVDGSMSSARIRVLIVDDHDLFRTGLRALLEEVGLEVAEAVRASAGLRRATVFAPQVVVMDMNMPGMSGVEATPLMREAAPDASILMLTIATDEAQVLDAVRAGASGYLLKDAELSDIVAGIHAAAAGHSTIAPRVAGHLLQSVRASGAWSASDNARSPSRESPEARSLSHREREVLVLLTEGYDNIEIATRLFVSTSTVKNHVSRLFEKLGVDNRVQAATFAMREGLFELV